VIESNNELKMSRRRKKKEEGITKEKAITVLLSLMEQKE